MNSNSIQFKTLFGIESNCNVVLVQERLEKVSLIVVFATHSYGVFVVFKARWHNQLVAVKRLTLPGNCNSTLSITNVFTSQLDDNEENAKEREQIGENFKRECDLMRKLPPHRHVLQVVGICK
jgi:hypothetical protein